MGMFDDLIPAQPEPASTPAPAPAPEAPQKRATDPTYWEDLSKIYEEGKEQVARGKQQMETGQGLWETTKGVGNTLGGVLGAAFSPGQAAVRQYFGRPLEKATGIPTEYTEIGAGLIGAGGLAKGASKLMGAGRKADNVAGAAKAADEAAEAAAPAAKAADEAAEGAAAAKATDDIAPAAGPARAADEAAEAAAPAAGKVDEAAAAGKADEAAVAGKADEPESWHDWAIGKALSAWNFPRAIMASGDLSMGLRQGIMALPNHPVLFGKAFAKQFMAIPEKGYLKVLDDIGRGHRFNQAIEGGLDIGAVIERAKSTGALKLAEGEKKGSRLGRMLSKEEPYMSEWADKIIGIKHSNQAFTAMGAQLRYDIFAKRLDNLERAGYELTPDLIKDVAKHVNTMTGRGHVPFLGQKLQAVANGAFFSPRLIASRIQTLNPLYYSNLHPVVRQQALKDLARFGAMGGGILGLAAANGLEVGTNPTSTDYGKIIEGNTRYDIWGGFQQPVVAAWRALSGKTTSTSGRVTELGSGPMADTRGGVMARFGRSKLHPGASMVVDALTNSTYLGDDFEAKKAIAERLMPMVSSDLYAIVKEHGIKGAWRGIPAFFGTSTRVYADPELVTGKDKSSKEGVQIRTPPDLAETIVAKVAGPEPLGKSRTRDIERFAKQLEKMEPGEADQIRNQIARTDKDLTRRLNLAIRNERKGITAEHQTLKMMGVENGRRAQEIHKNLQGKPEAERRKLLGEYNSFGLLNNTIRKQLKDLERAGQPDQAGQQRQAAGGRIRILARQYARGGRI